MTKTVADPESMLPASPTNRPVNHAHLADFIKGQAANWSMAQLRKADQRISARFDDLVAEE